MREHVEEIRRGGGDLAGIGTGDRAYAAAFAAQEDVDFPLLVDPELVSYAAAGAGRARATTLLRPQQIPAAARAIANRHRQHKLGAHPLQLGATHVIAAGGEVVYAWRNTDLGDDAPLSEVVDAVRGAAAA